MNCDTLLHRHTNWWCHQFMLSNVDLKFVRVKPQAWLYQSINYLKLHCNHMRYFWLGRNCAPGTCIIIITKLRESGALCGNITEFLDGLGSPGKGDPPPPQTRWYCHTAYQMKVVLCLCHAIHISLSNWKPPMRDENQLY